MLLADSPLELAPPCPAPSIMLCWWSHALLLTFLPASARNSLACVCGFQGGGLEGQVISAGLQGQPGLHRKLEGREVLSQVDGGGKARAGAEVGRAAGFLEDRDRPESS